MPSAVAFWVDADVASTRGSGTVGVFGSSRACAAVTAGLLRTAGPTVVEPVTAAMRSAIVLRYWRLESARI